MDIDEAFWTVQVNVYLAMRPDGRSSLLDSDYERNTGLAIFRYFKDRDSDAIPAILVASRGPFCWAKTPADAAHNAVLLEAIARMAYCTLTIPDFEPIPRELHEQHFLRKHGRGAYYGQVKAK